MSLLYLMTGKRRRDAGPAPETADFDDLDAWRAKRFGHWMRSHNITVDGFSSVSKQLSPPGISRTAVIALSGAAGSAVTSRWSTIRRPTLIAAWLTVNQVEPLRLHELREMLHIAADHDAGTWAEPDAVAGRGTGVMLVDAHLNVTWDVADGDGPHVYRVEGGYMVSQESRGGLVRLGRLRAITPIGE